MIKIVRTNSQNKDFIKLVKQLDAYLKITDEDEHDFYNQFNNIDVLKEVVVIYDTEPSSTQVKKPVGCGAIKKFDTNSVELKRMYVSEEKRGLGFAQKILTELEVWAKEIGYKKCVLETGKRQIEAVQFYKKSDYKVIPNYGQYKNMENSICFEKNNRINLTQKGFKTLFGLLRMKEFEHRIKITNELQLLGIKRMVF